MTQLRQVAFVGVKVKEDPLPPAELRGWALAVRRLAPARDAAAFEDRKGAIAVALERLAARIEGRP